MPAHAHTSNAAIVAAARRLLEEVGLEALTMRDVAQAVGVRTPSLYKRVSGRSELLELILEDLADELTAVVDAAAGTGDPAAGLRALWHAYRGFAHANPIAYTLLWAPQAVPGATGRYQRTSVTLLRLVTDLVGPQQALPSARTIVAWSHGFITMELAGAFRLGGDVDQAWDFGLDRVLDAIQPAGEARGGAGRHGRAAPSGRVTDGTGRHR
ncbi:TetR/AcrR family transcriptional regulator [Amycolatopsis sp. PS_44_ISF1]|uniref:TetR/AcrR family transcriptional regulator n=1 Tax=Amycolatopsis sp. PS_44_ISF1 TaxID=2974917 RepID=UPI0028DEADD3|nr:TetR/AcrR family transcriptional regulator [Amycolatopsis sp. PS_44_ISF1]MDT8914704.1 TetR/AcrR family transcriptional regulator [Amycolatopsis sp. PS_44_ISF1]